MSDYGKAYRGVPRGGGDVAISFGGRTQLPREHITDVGELAALYQRVLDNYRVNHIHFDIEGGALQQTEMLSRLLPTMAVVQQHNPSLQIAFTLPVDGQTSDDSQGLTSFGIDFVRMVHDAGISPALFNAMSMDFGDVAPPPDMYTGVEMSMLAMHRQIKTVFTEWSDAKLWRRIGVTPMLYQRHRPEFHYRAYEKTDRPGKNQFRHHLRLGCGPAITIRVWKCHTSDHNHSINVLMKAPSLTPTARLSPYQHKAV